MDLESCPSLGLECGVYDRLHIYPLCGIFYFPWRRHQIEGTNGFYCLIRKTERFTIYNGGGGGGGGSCSGGAGSDGVRVMVVVMDDDDSIEPKFKKNEKGFACSRVAGEEKTPQQVGDGRDRPKQNKVHA